MIKGLALTPPVIGRISIGRVVEKNGKRLPEKDDEFTITSQIQHKDGWITHPLDEALRGSSGAKLRSIPIKLLFDDPDLNMRANYTLFNRTTGRPVCVGDGETCRRATAEGIQSLECRTPDDCELAQGSQCKPYGRLNVRIGDEDELGTFILRTTGFNSIRTLMTRLRYFHAVSGGLLSSLPLELRLRGKSTTQSHRSTVFYVDLTLRTGESLTEAVNQARSERAQKKALGLDQGALDAAARRGMAQGPFSDVDEDVMPLLDEFFPESEQGDGAVPSGVRSGDRGLRSKLREKSERLAETDLGGWGAESGPTEDGEPASD